MLATVVLLVTSLAGFAVATRAVPSAPVIVRAPAGFLLALIAVSATTYLVARALANATEDGVLIGVIISLQLGLIVLWRYGRGLRRADLRMPLIDGVVSLFALAVGWWFMHQRLRTENGDLVVSASAWSDTALHVGLSRSFSVGNNFPTQYPFFAGEPIQYHFGFDFFAGAMEKAGMSVLWAFNLPGLLCFAALIMVTFATARLLFSPRVADGASAPRALRDPGVWTGIVAIVLLLTNQSQSWRRYVEQDGGGSLSRALDPSTLWAHTGYLANGPYSDDRISIFFTLNPFVAQTHLIVAIAAVLILAYVLLDHLGDGDVPSVRLMAGLGAVFGAMFWLNGVVWIAGGVFFAALVLVWAVPALVAARRSAAPGEGGVAIRAAAKPWLLAGGAFALPSLVLAVPQALVLAGSSEGLGIHLGYLVCSSTKSSCNPGQMNLLSPADWWSFVEYWWLNQSLVLPLLIVAAVLGTRRDRRTILAVMAIFLFGSVFAPSADIGGHGHKVFNLWEALAGLFVAFALVHIWRGLGRLGRRDDAPADGPSRRSAAARAGTVSGRIGVLLVGVFMTVSGVIDVMTVKNDFRVSVFGDPPRQEAIRWIVDNTPTRATFLTDYDQLFTASTLSGRRTYLGYSPWAAGAGYDVDPRKPIINEIYSTGDRNRACELLRAARIGYFIVGPDERRSSRFTFNPGLFAQFAPAKSFGTGDAEISVYEVAANC